MILKELLETVSRRTGAIANADPRHPRMWDIDDLKLLPRQTYHHGEYCQFRKLRGKNPACARNKKRSMAIAAHDRAFWGTCPFGIWDYAKPVFFDGSLIAVVYLGHYSSERPLADVDGDTYDGKPLEPITDAKHRELSHTADFIAEFMQLACQQWVDAGNSWAIERSNAFYEDACRNFIGAHYTEPIRLQDLAENLGMTANHLGAVIKGRLGASFRKMLETYRIQQAKVSLKAETWKSITEIAYECGFSDSNYFSTVFKKVVGTTPRAYRKGKA